MGSLSNYYACVQKMLTRMNSTSMGEFASLRHDEERIGYVNRIQGVDEILYVRPQYKAKSDSKAKIARELGNKAYGEKNFDDALTHYSKAVAQATWPEESEVTSGSFTTPSETFTASGSETDNLSNMNVNTGPVAHAYENVRNGRFLKRKQYKSLGSIASVDDNIFFSPLELPLALGNRSAALYQLGRYSECVADIDLALALGFQLHLRYKLYDRKGRCCLGLEQFYKAISCYEEVVKSLTHTTLSPQQRENIVFNCQKQTAVCRSLLAENSRGSQQSRAAGAHVSSSAGAAKSVQFSLEPCLDEPSYYLPNATVGTEIRYSQAKGRFAVTKKPLQVGDVVISEMPYASVLSPSLWYKRCYLCFKHLSDAPLGCFECTAVRFCSTECLNEAWYSFHRFECHYLGLLQSSGTGIMAHLALRVLLVTKHDELFKCTSGLKAAKSPTVKSIHTKPKGVFDGGFTSLFNLLTHSENRETNEMFQFAILAVYLLNILLHSGYVCDMNDAAKEHGIDPSDLSTAVGGVLLRFVQIIACNGIEITELSDGANISKTNPETAGLALFPTVSLLNHSCNPMLEILFFANRCVARCIQNVGENEEISIDYGYIYYSTPRAERQAYLKAQYHFVCDCLACRDKWPLKSRLPDGIPPLKCCECHTRLKIAKQKNPRECKCYRCGAVHNTVEIFDRLRQSSQAYERATERARAFKHLPLAVGALEKHVTLLSSHVCEPYKEYTSAVSLLKQCYRVLANKSVELVKTLEKPALD